VKEFWALLDSIYDVCVVITVAMAMLLREFGGYGLILMTVCVYYFGFFCHL
jgi:hypothetical protein